MKKFSNFYQCELGPHGGASTREQASFIKKCRTNVSKVFNGKHSFSTLVLLAASISFGINIFLVAAGAHGGLFGQKIQEQVFSVKREALGSDDGGILSRITAPEEGGYSLAENLPALKVSAEAFIVADVDTGEVIMERASQAVLPMASVTKLMTAIVTKENIDLHHFASVSKSSYNTYGTEGDLVFGEKIMIADLLYPLLLESSNDAAEVLADDYGREEFLGLLNGKAQDIGMDSTYFEDPSGLSPSNVTTATDLLRLAFYLKSTYPDLLDITRVKEYAIGTHAWENKNKFLTYPNFIGGKNGFINEAKQTTVSFFKVSFRGEDKNSDAKQRNVVVILLKSSDRDVDASNILAYISRNVHYEE